MRITGGVLVAIASLVIGCGEPAGSAETPKAEAGGTPSASPADDGDIGPVIATVGDVRIGEKEFVEAASRKTPENGTSLSDAEKREVLDRLIDEKALYLEARKRGIDRDPKVQKVMVNTLLREDVYSQVRNSDFSAEELQAYFDEHREEFIVPEKVQIRRIFVKVSDELPTAAAKQRADEVRGKLKADPNSFKELAAKYSDDPYKRRGGDLGFLSKEGKPGIDPAVVDKAFTMKVGEISEVFEAGGGFNIISVVNHREETVRTFEQMRGSVLRKVKNDKYKALYDEYVGKVKGGFEVDVDTKALQSADVTPASGPAGFPGMPGGIEAHPRPGGPPGPGSIRDLPGGDDDGGDDMGDED